jgi:hypothetical protein
MLYLEKWQVLIVDWKLLTLTMLSLQNVLMDHTKSSQTLNNDQLPPFSGLHISKVTAV